MNNYESFIIFIHSIKYNINDLCHSILLHFQQKDKEKKYLFQELLLEMIGLICGEEYCSKILFHILTENFENIEIDKQLQLFYHFLEIFQKYYFTSLR